MRFTVACATSSPSILRTTSAGAPGLAIVSSTSNLCFPGCDLPSTLRYGPLDDQHVVLVDEKPLVHIERDAAACAPERIEDPGCSIADLNINRDVIASLAKRRSSQLGHPRGRRVEPP